MENIRCRVEVPIRSRMSTYGRQREKWNWIKNSSKICLHHALSFLCRNFVFAKWERRAVEKPESDAYRRVNFSSIVFVLPTQESRHTALSRGIEMSGTSRSDDTSFTTYLEFPSNLRSAFTWISLQYPRCVSALDILRTTSPGMRVRSARPTWIIKKYKIHRYIRKFFLYHENALMMIMIFRLFQEECRLVMLYNIVIEGEWKCGHNKWSASGHIYLRSSLKWFRPCLQDTKSPGKETRDNQNEWKKSVRHVFK